LPHHLQTSGLGWLVASVVLVAVSMVVFAGRLGGLGVAATFADDAGVRWLAGLDAPGLEGIWRVLAVLGSWWVLNILGFGLLLALLVLRRFRHLIVVLVATQLLTMVLYDWVGPIAQRPRPFGVDIRTGWGGWALPSVQVKPQARYPRGASKGKGVVGDRRPPMLLRCWAPPLRNSRQGRTTQPSSEQSGVRD